MTNGVNIVLWLFKLYLVWFFLRSAYRKTVNFKNRSEEFRRWGYPYPRMVTSFLIMVWTGCAPFLLIPSVASGAAMILLVFMIVAFFTLVINKEWHRLKEPAVPILLLTIVAFGNYSDLSI